VSRNLWQNHAFCLLPLGVRLTYLGLLVFADDMGNVAFEPAAVRGMLFATDEVVTVERLGGWLATLGRSEFARVYNADQRMFAHLPGAVLAKTPRRVLCPLAPGQKAPKPYAPVVVELSPNLKGTFETFVAFVASKNAGGRVTDSRRLALTAAIADIASNYGEAATILGMREAIGHGAATDKYVRAVAKSAAAEAPPMLTALDGGKPDVRDMSLASLRATRGAHRR